MNRYFFNFRKGDEISPDRIGMYLHNLSEAQQEAIHTCHDLLLIAAGTGEPTCDCEIEIADASGEAVLCIPCGAEGETFH